MKRFYIEITNICNLHCSFCEPHQRPLQVMRPEAFSKIIQEVRPLTSYIYLHVQGEPLLHPQFDEIMQICDQNDMHVQLVTNGSLFRKEILTHPSLRRISVSLQSVDFQPAYEEEKTIRMIQNLIAFHQENQYVELRFWTNDLGSRASSLLDKLKKTYSFEKTNRPESWRISEHVYVSYAETFTWPSLAQQSFSSYGKCLGGIDQAAVLCDGTVTLCCLDKDGRIALGNIFETPLKKILLSDRYQNLINGFRNNRLHEELCQKCTYRTRFNKP